MKNKLKLYILFAFIVIMIVLTRGIFAKNKSNYGVPTGTVEFSTTDKTLKGVTATLTVDKEIETPKGWTKESKTKYTKKYITNNEENVVLKDKKNGTSSVISLKVSNVIARDINLKATDPGTGDHLTGPLAVESMTIEPTTPTNGDVVVTIVFKDVEQFNMMPKDDPDNEWKNIDEGGFGMTMQRTFTHNVDQDFVFYTQTGQYTFEELTVHIKIDNIDKDPAKCTIEKSPSTFTNQDVVVTLRFDEDVTRLTAEEQQGEKDMPVYSSDWEVIDKRTMRKTYKDNTEETDKIVVKDHVGNKTYVDIDIDYIDRDNPNVTMQKSNEDPTNKDVRVTITSDEPVKQIPGWNISEDQKILTKDFNANFDDDVIVSDLAGNEVRVRITLTNINQNPIVPNIIYSVDMKKLTNQDIKVTVEVDRDLRPDISYNDWQLDDTARKLEKVFKDNTTDRVTLMDIYGNMAQANILINNMDLKGPEIYVSRGQNKQNDTFFTFSAEDSIDGPCSGVNLETLKYELTDTPEEPESITHKLENGWTYSRFIRSIESYYIWISCEDNLGNLTKKVIEMELNNQSNFNPNISYSTIEDTTDPVEATISYTGAKIIKIDGVILEEGREVNGWLLETTNYGCTVKRTFSRNINKNYTIETDSGRTQIINIDIDNIGGKIGLLGDVNENGFIDTNDIIIIQRHLAASTSSVIRAKHPDWILEGRKFIIADVNEDNQVNSLDVQLVKRHLSASLNKEILKKHPEWIIKNK